MPVGDNIDLHCSLDSLQESTNIICSHCILLQGTMVKKWDSTLPGLCSTLHGLLFQLFPV